MGAQACYINKALQIERKVNKTFPQSYMHLPVNYICQYKNKHFKPKFKKKKYKNKHILTLKKKSLMYTYITCLFSTDRLY